MNDTTQAARHAISHVLAGNPPNGVMPEACGAWAETVTLLYAAHADGGTAAVRRLYETLARANRGLTALVAGDTKREQPAMPPTMPELPDGVLLPATLATEASEWLDGYIAFSRHWSPRSFDDFHESIAVWILSTVTARRVVAHLGKPQHTPLCIALAGRSSLHAKTTAAEVGIDLLRDAGLDWFLADDTATPQKFIRDRTQRVPDGYDGMADDEALRARLRLAFAGQCGWWYDEFGMLLHAMARNGGAMSDFSGLLRRFDDCAPSYTYGTIGRPTDKVLYPYLALLASLTPADLRPLMKRGSAGWTNGFWARWSFVTPPDDTFRTDRFPAGERRSPARLVRVLREWHDRLGIPGVAVHDGEAVVGPLPTQIVTIDPEVSAAFYNYGDALLALAAKSGSDELDSWYARLPTKALRVAMLISSIEGAPTVNAAHLARAQQVAERWRMSLHRLHNQVNAQQEASQEATAEEAILKVIERVGEPSVRDIHVRLPWLSNGEIADHIGKMVKADVVEPLPTARTIRYRLSQAQTTEDEEVKN